MFGSFGHMEHENMDTWMVTYNDVKFISQCYFIRNDNSLQAYLHLIFANGLKVHLFRDCFVGCFSFFPSDFQRENFNCYSLLNMKVYTVYNGTANYYKSQNN